MSDLFVLGANLFLCPIFFEYLFTLFDELTLDFCWVDWWLCDELFPIFQFHLPNLNVSSFNIFYAAVNENIWFWLKFHFSLKMNLWYLFSSCFISSLISIFHPSSHTLHFLWMYNTNTEFCTYEYDFHKFVSKSWVTPLLALKLHCNSVTYSLNFVIDIKWR